MKHATLPTLLPILVGLATLAPSARGGGRHAAAEAAAEVPARFDHERHDAFFGAEGLTCTSCHGFDAGGKPTWEGDRRDDCHRCHVAEEAGGKARVATPCTACHAEPPVPADHGAGWEQAHGAEARLDADACRACHPAAACVDCHERKESLRYEVHDRTWMSVHGVAARTDPFACDDCHAKSTCEGCHRAAGGRWP